MLYVVVIAIGFGIGYVVGRWWALLAAIGFAIWIGFWSDVDEVPPWFLGLMLGLVSACGIALGVFLRRLRSTRVPPP